MTENGRHSLANRPWPLLAMALAAMLTGGAGGWMVAPAAPGGPVDTETVQQIVEAERALIARVESHIDDAIGELRLQLRDIEARIGARMGVLDERLHDHVTAHRSGS